MKDNRFGFAHRLMFEDIKTLLIKGVSMSVEEGKMIFLWIKGMK
jgi:hypothetical protein